MAETKNFSCFLHSLRDSMVDVVIDERSNVIVRRININNNQIIICWSDMIHCMEKCNRETRTAHIISH